MLLMDVNILVYAHRDDTTDHPASRDWVEDTLNRGGRVWRLRAGAQWLYARGHSSEGV
jgi:predicted nucleic acid-binding protein